MYCICVTNFFFMILHWRTRFIIRGARLRKKFYERIVSVNRTLSVRVGCAKYFAMSIAYIGIGFTSTKEYKSRRETFEMGAQQRSSQKFDHFVALRYQLRFLRNFAIAIHPFVPCKILLSDIDTIFFLSRQLIVLAYKSGEIIPDFVWTRYKKYIKIFFYI